MEHYTEVLVTLSDTNKIPVSSKLFTGIATKSVYFNLGIFHLEDKIPIRKRAWERSYANMIVKD